MRVAFVQTSPRLGEVRRNLEEAWSLIERVKEADLAVLPELFHSGYAVRNKEEARALAVSHNANSEPVAMCLDAARQFRMNLAGGFLERDESSQNLYNSAWIIGPGGIIGAYRKIHPFDREWDIFTPGEKEPPVVSAAGARVSMQICFDWAFPEIWGKLAWGDEGKNGAQVIAHPVNLVLPDACPIAVRARALENRIYVVCAGRVGTDPGPDGEIIFRGGSRIVAPDGSILASGSEDKPGCEMVTIDPAQADDKYLTPRNHVLRQRFGTFSGESRGDESG